MKPDLPQRVGEAFGNEPGRCGMVVGMCSYHTGMLMMSL